MHNICAEGTGVAAALLGFVKSSTPHLHIPSSHAPTHHPTLHLTTLPSQCPADATRQLPTRWCSICPNKQRKSRSDHLHFLSLQFLGYAHGDAHVCIARVQFQSPHLTLHLNEPGCLVSRHSPRTRPSASSTRLETWGIYRLPRCRGEDVYYLGADSRHSVLAELYILLAKNHRMYYMKSTRRVMLFPRNSSNEALSGSPRESSVQVTLPLPSRTTRSKLANLHPKQQSPPY
ncbi:hypothetical protein B0H67DRAFT_93545 [Lasiosphaeris hirsuta]|uniref:Uncharacterized protein n=1 Tax=Lasiosphaeris hirsuta TaxID=260670 RepID=A0AA40BDA8_9PEZI|nr:hypothetical protein B0H67DRAFT_93545 [Lasiosphaeris hirsuta]